VRYEFVNGKWVRHVIDTDSGVGTQFLVQDMNHDGLLDIVVANKNGVFLVVDHESSIAGTASAVSDDCGAHVDLLRLYVRPSHQGGGLGAKLLEATLRRFPRAQDIALDVEPANLRAIAFYQRQGFVAAATVSDCSGSGDGIPALHMVRKTTAWSAT